MKEYVKKEGFFSALGKEMSSQSAGDALKNTGKVGVVLLAAYAAVEGAKAISKRVKAKKSKTTKKK